MFVVTDPFLGIYIIGPKVCKYIKIASTEIVLPLKKVVDKGFCGI